MTNWKRAKYQQYEYFFDLPVTINTMLSKDILDTTTNIGNFTVKHEPNTYRFYYGNEQIAYIEMKNENILVIDYPFSNTSQLGINIYEEFAKSFSVTPYSFYIPIENIANSVLKYRSYIYYSNGKLVAADNELFINGKERIARCDGSKPYAAYTHYEKCLIINIDNLYRMIRDEDYSVSEILCVTYSSKIELNIAKKLCELIIEEFPIKQIVFVDGSEQKYCVVDLTGDEYDFEMLKYKKQPVLDYISKYFKGQLPKPKTVRG